MLTGRKIRHTQWNPKCYYSPHKRPPQDTTTSQTKPVYITLYRCKTMFNIKNQGPSNRLFMSDFCSLLACQCRSTCSNPGQSMWGGGGGCGEHSGTGMEVSLGSSVSPCQHNSNTAPYPHLFHPPLKLHNLRI
jgi:hypothetical protein